MKKYKFASAVAISLIGVLMLVASILTLVDPEEAYVYYFCRFGIGLVAVILLVSGILKNENNNLPINKKLHISLGVFGLIWQVIILVISRFFGYAAFLGSTVYAVMLLGLELKELKLQKGFLEKGFALLISIFGVLYAAIYLVTLVLSYIKALKALEMPLFAVVTLALPALLIAKGVIDIVRSVKKDEPSPEPAPEPAQE